jgi:hypothetical protein
MALPSALKLFIDPKLGLAFGNFSGSSQITKPSFTLGDTAGIEIYLVESTQVANYPRQELPFPVSPGIKVAVGAIDESPAAGTWTMSYGGNTTSALPYNATATQLQTALNALASITSAGGVTVSKIGDNYNIAFNLVGARTELTTDSTALIPLSTAVVAVLQEGSASKVAISLVHLQRTVAGLATTFTQTEDCEITIESLGAWDGSKANYRLSISPDPKGGSFTISFDAQTGDDVSTSAIQVGASGQDVQNALNIKALADKVTVTQVGAYSYDITVATQPGTAGLTANDAGLLSFSGYVGDLSLNTAEAISLLDGAESVETTLEVEITSDTKTLTLLQIPCTLKNAVIDVGSVQPLVLDTYLSQTTADGRYLRQSNNLSDVGSASTARTNLAVYSTSQVDTALALKANLAEPIFSGKIQTPTIKNILNADLVIDSYNDTGAGTHYLHKFTPFDGKFVLAANGGGLTFPDGTTQGTAATTPDLSGYAPLASPTFSGVVGVGSSAITGRIRAESYSLGSYLALEAESGARQAVISNGGEFSGVPFITLIGSTGTASIYGGRFYSGSVGSGVEPYARKDGATFTGKVNLTDLGTNNPSFNIGGTALSTTATNAVSGDVWISGTSPKVSYKVGTSNFYCATSNLTNTFSSSQIIDTTATTPALRVTQKGTGNAIVIEDSTTPDTSGTFINNAGLMGIQMPSDFTLTEALTVGGNILASNFKCLPGSGSAFYFQSGNYLYDIGGQGSSPFSGNLSVNDYPIEIEIQASGTSFKVPARYTSP